MGKRGPRPRAAPGIAEIPAGAAPGPAPERPPVSWDRLILTAAQAGEVEFRAGLGP